MKFSVALTTLVLAQLSVAIQFPKPDFSKLKNYFTHPRQSENCHEAVLALSRTSDDLGYALEFANYKSEQFLKDQTLTEMQKYHLVLARIEAGSVKYQAFQIFKRENVIEPEHYIALASSVKKVHELLEAAKKETPQSQRISKLIVAADKITAAEAEIYRSCLKEAERKNLG